MFRNNGVFVFFLSFPAAEVVYPRGLRLCAVISDLLLLFGGSHRESAPCVMFFSYGPHESSTGHCIETSNTSHIYIFSVFSSLGLLQMKEIQQ